MPSGVGAGGAMASPATGRVAPSVSPNRRRGLLRMAVCPPGHRIAFAGCRLRAFGGGGAAGPPVRHLSPRRHRQPTI